MDPLWLTSTDRPLPRFPRLERDLSIDVAVVGAGITGVTTAYLLARAGLKVALLERDRWGRGDTGHTTAHLTHVTDTRLDALVKRFGRDHAQAAWEAGAAAIDQIETIVREHAIDCEYCRVPGFLHAPWRDDKPSQEVADDFKREAGLAGEMGFDAAFEDAVPLAHRPGVRYANQAKFHPMKYLAALLDHAVEAGVEVFEDSNVDEVSDKPLTVHANGHAVRCEWVVICTHVPLLGKTNMLSGTLLQAKLAPYSTYAVAAQIPAGAAPEASFWDTDDPYLYLRIDSHAGHDVAILGGQDHKTGQVEETGPKYAGLEERLLAIFPQAKLTHRWSGQVIESADGLPYIGEGSSRQFISTGFAGNGTTFGTLAAMMARDAIRGVGNPWADLFSVQRKPLRAAWNYLRKNLDYPYYMLKDRLAGGGSRADGPPTPSPGTGEVLRIKGKPVAIYCDLQGRVTRLSAICTHMGCVVTWNQAESTWDCPCHGSRFTPTGDVHSGPAETPLPGAAAE